MPGGRDGSPGASMPTWITSGPVAELHLSPGAHEALRAACQHEYPREACGLLLGVEEGARRVRQVIPARNLAAHRDAFTLDPSDFVRADSEARDAGLEILGIFHSHPDRDAVPSRQDLAAAQAGWSHVIVPVSGDAGVGRAAVSRSWRLADDGDGRRLVEESLRVEGTERTWRTWPA